MQNAIRITPARLNAFGLSLRSRERSSATIEKYIREAKVLATYLHSRPLSKPLLLEYREQLRQDCLPQTVNGKLIAINAFLQFCGLDRLRVQLLRVQHTSFVKESREMSEAEYHRLLKAAQAAGNDSLYHVMLTISGTGIRISELKFITMEAVRAGRAQISMKGKSRVILLPKLLRTRLMTYAATRSITEGILFRTKNGKPLDRSNICHDMKKLCREAKVEASKVFPHNFRHLFARCFYAIEKDLSRLADILGHSSIETTRIYVATSENEYQKILGRMRLIV